MMKVILAAAIIALVWYFLKPKAKSGRLPDVDQACDILGVNTAASADDVRAAHRRLIATLHPDRGGSAELTRQINDARDVLLRRLGN